MLCVFVYLCKRGHSQQRVLSDGMVSEVWRRKQWFNTANLAFRATEQTSRVTRPHPHHPSGGKEKQKAFTETQSGGEEDEGNK